MLHRYWLTLEVATVFDIAQDDGNIYDLLALEISKLNIPGVVTSWKVVQEEHND